MDRMIKAGAAFALVVGTGLTARELGQQDLGGAAKTGLATTALAGAAAAVLSRRRAEEELSRTRAELKANDEKVVRIAGRQSLCDGDLQAENADLQQTVTQLRATNDVWRTGFEGLKSEYASLETVVADLTQEKGALQRANHGLSINLEMVSGSKKDLVKLITGLKEQMAEKDKETRALTGQIQSLTQTVEAQAKKIATDKTEIDALRKDNARPVDAVAYANMPVWGIRPVQG
jgi:chromosome segregation ATPase